MQPLAMVFEELRLANQGIAKPKIRQYFHHAFPAPIKSDSLFGIVDNAALLVKRLARDIGQVWILL